MDVLAYLDKSIATFDGDPPVNDYQRGHFDALKVARAEIATLSSLTWRALKDAPRDGTMVWLLIDYGAYGDHPLADARLAATLGFCNYEHDHDWPVDRWQYVGWNWEQDCYCNHETDNHKISVIVAWMPIGFPLGQEDGEVGASLKPLQSTTLERTE